jgi:hypothetical protein
MITSINVFLVEQRDQPRLVELLACVTDEFVSRRPGFNGATLHRSLDWTKVTMYAQKDSLESYESMRRDPAQMRYLEEALAIATFDPGIYEVVRTFKPAIE